jgi:hypothetical protein
MTAGKNQEKKLKIGYWLVAIGHVLLAKSKKPDFVTSRFLDFMTSRRSDFLTS